MVSGIHEIIAWVLEFMRETQQPSCVSCKITGMLNFYFPIYNYDSRRICIRRHPAVPVLCSTEVSGKEVRAMWYLADLLPSREPLSRLNLILYPFEDLSKLVPLEAVACSIWIHFCFILHVASSFCFIWLLNDRFALVRCSSLEQLHCLPYRGPPDDASEDSGVALLSQVSSFRVLSFMDYCYRLVY
uniref:Uncharacterized protein n=1 Tax=Solanum lycopersicum TaxID=4081 RepID=A0A3Q7JIE2_SOLLC